MAKKREVKKKYPFPAELYVRYERDGDDGYFLADKTINEAEDGEVIAFYTLNEIIKKRVTHDTERVD